MADNVKVNKVASPEDVFCIMNYYRNLIKCIVFLYVLRERCIASATDQTVMPNTLVISLREDLTSFRSALVHLKPTFRCIKETE